MHKITEFFQPDEEYKKQVQTYSRGDGLLAIGMFLLVMLTYYIMGVIYLKKNLYLGFQVNLALALICAAGVFLRWHSLKSIGFGRRNILKSGLLGFLPSFLLISVILVFGLTAGGKLYSASELASGLCKFLIVIGLVEELLFRGFIQTRIYGLVKHTAAAIVLAAVMFMLIHIPFQMATVQMGPWEYISSNYFTLLCTFFWHIVFNFLYSKYNSILAPVIFHGFLDWSNYLFMS